MNNDLFVDKAILQLKLLKSAKLLDPSYESGGYICPICKKIFVGNEVKNLTQEDAPQDKLGGKRIALTCKDCNNTCGPGKAMKLTPIEDLDYWKEIEPIREIYKKFIAKNNINY